MVEFLPHAPGYPRFTADQHSLSITVPKTNYDLWESFEDELYDHCYYNEMLFEQELRGSWKYIVRLQRDRNYASEQ